MSRKLERKERYGFIGTAIVLLVIGFVAGVFMGGGSLLEKTASDSADTAELEQTVQSFVDQQIISQNQQLQMIVEQDENLSSEDVSMDATVTSIQESDYGSLYRVNVSVTGQIGQLQDVDRQQIYYISPDGRYLFQQPIDLEQPQ